MAPMKAKKKSGIMAALMNNYTLVFLALAIVFAAIQIHYYCVRPSEALLTSFLLFNVGLQGIFAGCAHWYRPIADNVARKIGWLPGSPFQKEVAAADIAVGIIGILSYWIRGDFITATAICASIMLFLMGVVHLLDRKNKSVYNTGSVLFFDIVLPVVMVALLVLWKTGN